jgi:L-2-hydroxyglutarate oxidase LhgO
MGSGSYDVGVIGGGIIGLATALRLTQEYPRYRVAVLEKESEVARHQTGHNSGVIHAGIYYSPGSQKANFCSPGGKMLRRYCDEHDIDYELCGKVIVATEESDLPRLEELRRRGIANGADGLEVIGEGRLRELEPHAAGIRAIYSPNTGIVDYTKVTLSFASEMVRNGGDLLTGTRVLRAATRDGRVHLETSKGDVAFRYVINCAGLYADTLAREMGIETGVRILPFRGEFYSLKPGRSNLVNGLIYPVPKPKLPFLGVHFTRRIDGSVEAGPNAVLAYAREGYRKSQIDLAEVLGILTYPGFWRMSRAHWRSGLKEQYRSWVKRSFVRSLQTLVPEVRKEDLDDATAGVRAQAVGRDGELLQDFSIVRTENSIHVLNAPSPAATACLSISRHIVDLARATFELAA